MDNLVTLNSKISIIKPEGIVNKLYEAASILRWNDHVKPVELTEIDKQSHKMIIAFLLGKFEETYGNLKIDWVKLIEGSIFEFLHRVVLTDIKPPVFHKMMKEKGTELNAWVMNKLKKDLMDVSEVFFDKFKQYWFSSEYAKQEKRLLSAAHYLATSWEFKIVYPSSAFLYGIEKTKEEIDNKMEDFSDLIGVEKISLHKKSYGFVDLCSQLRFQQRWAQIPRIPKTSVLGHMYIVAVMSYIKTIQLSPCDKRIYNNFFAGLFHDLPEVLTRDIISPIKRSVEGLDKIIKDYENLQLEEKLLPLLPDLWHDEIRYFVKEEFENKIIGNNERVKDLSIEDFSNKYNEDKFSPIDGKLIKLCDIYAAYKEVDISIEMGLKSKQLVEARKNIGKKLGF